MAPAPRTALIVEDSAEQTAAGQMRRSEFLDRLRAEVCSNAEDALAGTIWSTRGCPWIDYWFRYYAERSSVHIERAVHRYVPETVSATLATDYITAVARRVRSATETWVASGEVTGVPELLGRATAPAGVEANWSGSSGGLFFKGREGGARPPRDPGSVPGRLGRGRPLDAPVRSRMQSVFGADLSRVRVHTDGAAASLNSGLNARAFTLGSDIAFGSGEYRPGTLLGDALIAHEIAHVVQQGSAADAEGARSAGPERQDLESDADRSAVGAILALSGAARGVASAAVPRLRSGLQLQRCRSSPSCANPGNARSVDLQPVFFRTDPTDAAPTGTSWIRRFNESNTIWGKLAVTFNALSTVTQDDPVRKTAGSTEAEILDIMSTRTSAGVEVFLVDNDLASVGGGGTARRGTDAAQVVISDRGTSDTLLAHELGHVLGMRHPGQAPNPGEASTIMDASNSHSAANPTRNTIGNYNKITWPAPGAATCLHPDP